MNLSPRILVLAAIAAALLLAVGAFFLLRSHEQIAYSDTDRGFNAAYWKDAIEREGGKNAYQEFLTRNATAPLSRRHVSIHIMGQLLYEAYGLAGVGYCDASFAFGCYHGFFGRAIEESGEAAIPKLADECIRMYGPLGTGCTHGIGHGILEYTGTERLADALVLCDKTHQPRALLGCTSGVFMEYDTPLVSTSTGSLPKRRPLDSTNPYAPCTEVAERFQPSCYFELGNWYRIGVETLKEAGTYCGGLTGDARRYCFLGVGNVTAVRSGEPSAESPKDCDQLAATDALYCRAGMSWSFYSHTEYRSLSRGACAYTDEARTKECEKLADFAGQHEHL